MAKIRAMGDSVQIKSELTKTTIERASKYCPNALKILEGNPGEDVYEKFAIGLGNASVSKYGILFPNTDDDGKVFVTMENPVKNHSNKEYEKTMLQEEYAVIISNLNQIEAQVTAVEAELTELEIKAGESIEVM